MILKGSLANCTATKYSDIDLDSSALAYANHIWKPTNENNFHGYDTDGIFINTPDFSYVSVKYNCGWWIIDQYNKGIPYNWDGSATI